MTDTKVAKVHTWVTWCPIRLATLLIGLGNTSIDVYITTLQSPGTDLDQVGFYVEVGETCSDNTYIVVIMRPK